MNGLSGDTGPEDELCNFEKLHGPPFTDCGEDTGFGGVIGIGCVSRLDYVRYALLKGLVEEERIGVNPYKLGIIASTDTHNAAPGMVADDSYPGNWGNSADPPQDRLGPKSITHQGIITNPGGLTAVWAFENSRDAIFDAFKRRETYATSGPRIEVRFFGGWQYPDTMCTDPDFVETGYQLGVPMGADLPPPPKEALAPTFAISAVREQDFGNRTGTPLQRIQIIKGWIDSDHGPMLAIYDVAGDPYNGASVDIETCQRTGDGFDRLCTVWTDPDFVPGERAFYYVRVVENPSCRWSTYECNRLPVEERPIGCSDPTIQKVIQERAWTSPIWYNPGP